MKFKQWGRGGSDGGILEEMRSLFLQQIVNAEQAQQNEGNRQQDRDRKQHRLRFRFR